MKHGGELSCQVKSINTWWPQGYIRCRNSKQIFIQTVTRPTKICRLVPRIWLFLHIMQCRSNLADHTVVDSECFG